MSQNGTRYVRSTCKITLWDNDDITNLPSYYTKRQLYCRLILFFSPVDCNVVVLYYVPTAELEKTANQY